MDITRRKFVLASAASAAVVGTAGCAGRNLLDRSPRVTFSGNVHSEEPLVRNTGISIEDPYPNYYSKLVTTKKAEDQFVRRDYIEQNHGLLGDHLHVADYESEFLLFVGMVLPVSKQLQPGPTRIKDETLHAEYRVESSGKDLPTLAVNTAFMRIIRDDQPRDSVVNVQYRGY